jgi:zinc protease
MAETAAGGFARTEILHGVHAWRHRSNGLTLLICPTLVAPVVSVGVVYEVGTRHESIGSTGAGHLLEHLLFKGTRRFNHESGTEMALLLQRAGARFNATTSFDRTAYYATLPADQMALALEIEAARMSDPLLRDVDLESERTVVLNELDRGENEPIELLMKRSFAMAFLEHPYRNPTIGWRSDVEQLSGEVLRRHYDTYYHPDNATLIIAGNVVEEQVLATVEQYFGELTPAPGLIPEVCIKEAEQGGERRFKLDRAGELGLICLTWRTPQARHADSPALSVLTQVLTGGVTSRLYQRLIESNQCISVHARQLELHDPGVFQVTATLAPGASHAAVEEAIRQEVQGLQQAPPAAGEMKRTLAWVRFYLATQWESPEQILRGLSEAVALGDWRRFTREPELVDAVAAGDLQRVAATFLVDSSLTSGWFIPESARSARPPDAGAREETGKAADTGPAHGSPEGRREEPSLTLRKDGSFSERVRLYDLTGGGHLAVLANPHMPTVTIHGTMQAGLTQTCNGRLTTVAATAAMLERGTANHDRLGLAREREDHALTIGIETMHTTPSLIFPMAHGPAGELGRMISLLIELISRPTFPESELEQLKELMLGRMAKEKSSTFAQAFASLARHLYPSGHPLTTRPLDVRMKEVATLTSAELRAFHARAYRPDSLNLAVVGRVDPDEVHELLEQSLAGWRWQKDPVPALPEPLPVAAGEYYIDLPDRPNLDVILGHQSDLRRGDREYPAAALANACLGQSTLTSRLGRVLREQEGLTYGIFSCFYGDLILPGPWLIYFSVSPENHARALELTRSIVNEYVRSGPDEAELSDERKALAGTYRVELASSAGVARELSLVLTSGQPISYLDTFPEELQAVSREAVIEVMQRYIRPDDLTLVAAGSLPR